MNHLASQSFKYSLVGYFGFLLGTLSSLFIFPYHIEFYGKLRYILPTAELIVPIVVLGLSYANVKFYFINKKNNTQHNFLWLSLFGVCFNFIIFFLFFTTFFHIFPSLKESKLWQMKKLIFSIVLVLSFSQVLNKYISNLKRIVVPNIFENLFPKLANLFTFCLVVFIGVSENFSYWIFFIFFVLSLFGYFIYLFKLEEINFNFSYNFLQKNNYWKEIGTYSFFIFMGNIGNFIATRIDNYMIGEYIGFEENGIYSTFLSIIGLISIPQMGLNAISAPIINKALEEKRYQDLNIFHKKTSIYLFFIGLTLFSCLYIGFPFLTTLIKNGEQFLPYQNIILILGASLLFDLATGFNGYIISMSQYYKFNIVVMLFLTASTIFLNYYFINYTNLGITGVAIATAISLALFNLIKIIFNQIKFGVFPISFKMFYLMGFAIIGVLFIKSLPDFSNNLLNLIYKPTLILLTMLLANLFIKIIPIKTYLNKNIFNF